MTKKAYIVANEKQEREVLEKFERDGIVWVAGIEKPTEWIPSQLEGAFTAGFPYALVIDNKGRVSWSNIRNLTNQKIVFDGRKEEQMSEKYVVSQEFMNKLKDWKENNHLQPRVSFDGQYVSWQDLESIPMDIKKWLHGININDIEINNRLITILRWVNGEDVFEVEKPKKWAVRSKATDNDGDYRYVSVFDSCFGITYADSGKDKLENATHFDTKEKAESWANAHQEVIEVEVD